MFEEIATSAGQLLLVIFGAVLFFIVVYGALWFRAAKRAKPQ
jgi:heme/copper-type cytochrome/quinol oxidase subunit 4